MINKMFFFLLWTLIIIIPIIFYSKLLAMAIQQLYIRAGRNTSSGSAFWKEPWMQVLFQAIVIFAGLVVAVMLFTILFGPISV